MTVITINKSQKKIEGWKGEYVYHNSTVLFTSFKNPLLGRPVLFKPRLLKSLQYYTIISWLNLQMYTGPIIPNTRILDFVVGGCSNPCIV